MSAPKPGSAEWAAKVTASKVAAILGLSPWESQYSMWLKMRGDIAPDDSSNAEAKSRGHYLEAGVVAWWLDQHPELSATARTEQGYEQRDEWAAATPDLTVHVEGASGPAFRIVLDAKTAASADDWGDEPPAYYLVQSLWQMWVCDADVAYIAVLFGRPQLGFREYRIERDDELIESIVTRCREFYDSLALDEAPDLDDSVATYEAVRALHPDIEPKGSEREEVEVDRATAHEFVTANLDLKEAETRERAAKTVLLDAMGRSRLAKCDGLTVARRQPNAHGVSLVRVAKHIDPPTELQETA